MAMILLVNQFSIIMLALAVSVRPRKNVVGTGEFGLHGALTVTSMKSPGFSVAMLAGVKDTCDDWMRRSVRIWLQAVCTLAVVAPFLIAARTPSYAEAVSDCFKNNAEHDSIVAITMSITIGKQTASSAAATPRRAFERFVRRKIPIMVNLAA